MNGLQKEAFYWLERGGTVIPIDWKRKTPSVEWLPYTEQVAARDEVGRWFGTRLHNIAVVAGWNNLAILDFDDMARFEDWTRWCKTAGSEALRTLETTRIVLSARGAHVYIYASQAAENMKLTGVDVLARRKYVLAPPSIHPSGRAYAFLREADPVRVGALDAVLPREWLEAAVCAGSERTLRIDANPRVVCGDLNDAGRDRSAGKSVSLAAEIRARYRLENFLPTLTPTSRKGWFICRCPLHDDKTPSMWVDANEQLCGCFSGCTVKPLDVIGLYARLYKLSTREAICELGRR